MPEHPYIDINNPQHFINLVTDKLREMILSIPHRYFEFSEVRLIEDVFHGPPDEADVILRLNFWEEYNRCFLALKTMTLKNITEGVMNPENIYRHFAPHPGKLAFMISEPIRIQNRIKYAYHLAINDVIKKLLAAEIISPKTGLPDPKLQQIKVDLFKYLDQRLHGSIVQRIEQKTDQRTLQVNVTPSQVGQIQGIEIPENLDERLRELEQELSQHNALPPAMDASITAMEKIVQEAGRVTEEFKRDR